MGEIDEGAVVDALRALLEQRRVKLTALAKDIEVPYRTLQNYMYKKNRLPIPVYVRICERLGITADYPLHQRFRVDHHALQNAVLSVLGPVLPQLRLSESLAVALDSSQPTDRLHERRTAGMLASLIASEYDRFREQELGEPLDDDD